MKEFVLKGDNSLTQTLALMNKLIASLQEAKSNKKNDFLTHFKKNVKTSCDEAWSYICKQADSFDPQERDMVDHTVLFQTYQLPVYLGKKDHGVMFCKNMVIGLKLELDDGASVSYRLDFDNEKKLHINFEIFCGRDEKYPFCIPIYFSTGRYGFSLEDKASCKNNPSKELVLLELMKVKFWLKMTIGHSLAVMIKEQKTSLEQNDELPMEQQLLAFIQGQKHYSFDSVRKYVMTLLPANKGRLKIEHCKNEQELLQCINEKPVIRSKTRNSIFLSISKYDPDGQLLSGLYHNDDVALGIDSDKRIDSDQPPKLK